MPSPPVHFPANATPAPASEAAAWMPASLDVAETLQSIAASAQQALGADRATCYANDAAGKAVSEVHTTETDPKRRAFLEAAVGRGPQELPIWKTLVDSDDAFLCVEDVSTMSNLPDALVRGLRSGAFLGIRLEHPALTDADGRPIFLGALFCTFSHPRAFSDAEMSAARGLSALAVLALANAHLFDEAGAALARASAAAVEQAALRRVATAVAEDHSSERVFALVAEEASRVLGGDSGAVMRFDSPDVGVVVGSWAADERLRRAEGTRLPLRGGSATAQVARDGAAARVDDYAMLDRETLRALGRMPFRCGIAAPVRVGADLWGAVTVQSGRTAALPRGCEERLASFAELVGMAIANTDARARLAREAGTDSLTDLPNRRALEAVLEDAFTSAEVEGRTLSLLVFDLDDFKAINDLHGHDVGDTVLRIVARTLEAALRPCDLAGRVGGEEFLVILPDTGAHGAALVAERLRSAISIAAPPGDLPVTASVGVATFPSHASSAGELLRAADAAMYDAKGLGRNRTVVFSTASARTRVESSRRAQSEHEGYLKSVLSLAAAVDERDPSTHAHSTTVARYVVEIAGRLGLDGDHVEDLRVAGLLHDIGKVGVPDAVLQKPGPLDDAEWIEMRRHPEIGARIVAHPALANVREWVLRHHERPDGAGYPDRLAGGEIPLEARILSVADAFEAMTADRPYRRALPLEVARAELVRGRGTQFDPAVVDVFLAYLDDQAGASLAMDAPGLPG